MRNYKPKERPGVIIYFDMRPALERLSMEERGELLTAAMNYAEYGEAAELGGMVGMCFDMMRPKIDRDEEAYQAKVTQSRYAGYCSRTRAKGRDPLDYEDWLEQNSGATTVDDRQRLSTPVNEGQPNTITTANTTTTTNTNQTTTTGTAPASSRPELASARDKARYYLERARQQAMQNGEDPFKKHL